MNAPRPCSSFYREELVGPAAPHLLTPDGRCKLCNQLVHAHARRSSWPIPRLCLIAVVVAVGALVAIAWLLPQASSHAQVEWVALTSSGSAPGGQAAQHSIPEVEAAAPGCERGRALELMPPPPQWTSERMQVTVVETSPRGNLSCASVQSPSGFSVVYVVSATYGADGDSCTKDVAAQFRSLCYEQQTCTWPMQQTFFSHKWIGSLLRDPCPGRRKTLRLVYECVEPGNYPQTIPQEAQQCLNPPRFAYVTLLTQLSYLKWAIALLQSFRRVGSAFPLLVMVPATMHGSAKKMLRDVGAVLVEVEMLQANSKDRFINPHWLAAMTKLRMFGLTNYEKLMWIDSDALVLQNVDSLFWRNTNNGARIWAVQDRWTCDEERNRFSICSGLVIFSPNQTVYEELIALSLSASWRQGDQEVLWVYFGEQATGTGRSIGLLPEQYSMFANRCECRTSNATNGMGLWYVAQICCDYKRFLARSLTEQSSEPSRYKPACLMELYQQWWKDYNTALSALGLSFEDVLGVEALEAGMQLCLGSSLDEEDLLAAAIARDRGAGLPDITLRPVSQNMCARLDQYVVTRTVKVAADTEPAIRVYCAIYTYPKNEHKAKAAHDTWLSHCDGYALYSEVALANLPSERVVVPGGENYDNSWQKIMAMWKQIFAKHSADFDWFWIGGDDVFLIVENLKHMLREAQFANASHPFHLGHLARFEGQEDNLFHLGGPGYLLNRVGLERLVQALHKNVTECGTEKRTSQEDVMVSRCLQSQGVPPIDTKDADNKLRMMPFSPKDQVTYCPRAPRHSQWYRRYAPDTRTGLDCCSSFPVAYHYLNLAQMYCISDILYTR